MQKDIDGWNKEKKTLQFSTASPVVFHEKEIWWCSIGVNLGDEQDGKNRFFERPVLVIKKFNNSVAWVLPLKTKRREGIYYHDLVYDGQVFSVILSQIRLVSVKRFRRFVRQISPGQFGMIKSKLSAILNNSGGV